MSIPEQSGDSIDFCVLFRVNFTGNGANGYIKSGVDDIKRKQEKEDERHVQVVSRLTAVEASAKQAHHRLDSLEGKMTEK